MWIPALIHQPQILRLLCFLPETTTPPAKNSKSVSPLTPLTPVSDVDMQLVRDPIPLLFTKASWTGPQTCLLLLIHTVHVFSCIIGGWAGVTIVAVATQNRMQNNCSFFCNQREPFFCSWVIGILQLGHQFHPFSWTSFKRALKTVQAHRCIYFLSEI